LERNNCSKKRFDKISAMFVVANAQKPSQKSFKRKEKRIYFCVECNSWHVTSKNKIK